MQIMVPLDGSSLSERALPFALSLARRSNALLHLIRVLPRPWDTHGRGTAVEGITTFSACEHYLSERALELAAWPVRVRWAVLQGPVDTTLEAYATDADIDLVVMTTHGRGGIMRAWLGSIAEGLLHRISIPVLLIRPGFDPLCDEHVRWDRMLVPLDGSRFSACALETALRLAGDAPAACILLHVLPAVRPISLSDSREPYTEAKALRAEAWRYLTEHAERIRKKGYPAVSVVTTAARIADAIVEQARSVGATIIVMATHARRGSERLALGSVASEVMQTVHLPVLMVRPRELISEPRGALLEGSRRFDAAPHTAAQYSAAAVQAPQLLTAKHSN